MSLILHSKLKKLIMEHLHKELSLSNEHLCLIDISKKINEDTEERISADEIELLISVKI